MDYIKHFEARLYQITNELRSLARGLQDEIAQRLYETLSHYQDMVVDYGVNVAANEEFILVFRQGEEFTQSHRDYIREWRREGMIS